MSTSLHIAPDVSVSNGNRLFRIKHILDLETVLAVNELTGALERLFIKDLAPPDAFTNKLSETADEATDTDIMSVDKVNWDEADRRYRLIKPLLDTPRRTREMVEEQARSAGVHAGTLYRWMLNYLCSEQMSALLPNKRGFKKGRSRLSPELDAIVDATIEDFYRNTQKRSVIKTCEEVENRCRNAGFKPPHRNTIRNRINGISEEAKIEGRQGRKAARDAFAPVRGRFPGADFPLAYVQIDHTLLDIILVHEETRKPVGRPWFTAVIDVFSRMLCGFYISLDPPGALATGLALAHSILPKENWLKQYDIETPWSVWGIPRTIHADNAKEFRGEMLRRACQEYGIDTNFRLVATPHYGGHIERFLGTVATEIHALPGTTFSNPIDKGDYDSEGKAVFTLKDLEKWLATFFVEVYHQRVHSALGMSPAKKYLQGVMGSKDRPGTGLPKRITDEIRLRLDFMPYFERSIQQYGVRIDNVEYYHDVLRPFINAIDPADPKKTIKRKFTFRRDPRDISRIFFYDPERKQYWAIPYSNMTRPTVSIWELRAAARQLQLEGRKDIDENSLFAAMKKMRDIQENATKKTKHILRSNERRRYHGTGGIPLAPAERGSASSNEDPLSGQEDIKPFDEIEKIDR